VPVLSARRGWNKIIGKGSGSLTRLIPGRKACPKSLKKYTADTKNDGKNDRIKGLLFIQVAVR